MNTLVFTLGEHRSQLTLKISTYPNGNLAIKLYEKDHGILIFWETLTTNLTGIRPDRFHQYKSRRRTFSSLAVRQSPCGTYRANS